MQDRIKEQYEEMQEYPYQPQEQAWPRQAPRRRLPRWALLAGLGVAFALVLGIGALIGSTVLPSLGASAASNNGAFAQFAHAGANGPGGRMHGPGGGYTVSSSTDTTITATTPKGASVTITTNGNTTYAEAGKTVARSAVTTKGTKIRAQGTRDSSGNITATHIEIVLPAYHGTVSAISGADITVTDPRTGTTHVIHTDANTTFTSGSSATTITAVAKNDDITAEGTLNSDGSMQALAVHIMLPHAGGKITAIASDDSSVTVQDPRDSTKSVTIHLSGSTTYTTVTKSTSGPPTQSPATVKSLQVGGYIDAEGAKNSDGSLNAQSVRILPGAPASPGHGPRGGPGGRHGHGSAPAAPTSGTTGA